MLQFQLSQCMVAPCSISLWFPFLFTPGQCVHHPKNSSSRDTKMRQRESKFEMVWRGWSEKGGEGGSERLRGGRGARGFGCAGLQAACSWERVQNILVCTSLAKWLIEVTFNYRISSISVWLEVQCAAVGLRAVVCLATLPCQLRKCEFPDIQMLNSVRCFNAIRAS